VYCPVDLYDGPDAIAADAAFLRLCARVVVHYHRLRPYFEPFAPVAELDHPVKFAAPLRRSFRRSGNLLWVGVCSNLPPLVEWANRHDLPAPLDVLTNFENPDRPPAPGEYGFRPGLPVRLHAWSPERQVAFTERARAALDVKGDDFRSLHKPPAKAVDFVASGLPLAMNPGSSPVEYLARLGLAVADPLDARRWLSEDYWRESARFGKRLRRRLTGERVGARVRRIVADVLAGGPEGRLVPQNTHHAPRPAGDPAPASARYEDATRLAAEGRDEDARRLLEDLLPRAAGPEQEALIRNDLAALAAGRGDVDAARAGFRGALALDPACEPARANLAMLDGASPPPEGSRSHAPVKVAVFSFLFNWPSTGGGIVHTVELALFLSRAGYEVRHYHVRFPPWGIGEVTAPLPFPSVALAFEEAEWNAAAVQGRFRAAADEYDPDYVILTDSWNFKPLLAEAVRDRPYVLRLQALECLCPLNNVRLLPDPAGGFRQCGFHQLATPRECARCVGSRGGHSGDLHRVERELSGFGTPAYEERLRRAFAGAEAVLVVNPLGEAMVSPYCRDVRVVTAGMDPARFPWPPPGPAPGGKKAVLFAGLVGEWMKGFHVLHAACGRLWRRRQDFELVATADPAGPVDAFTRYVGWQPQGELPKHLWASAVLAMPTVAQEALGRTAVEAMAAGRPVLASRIGGLPFTVTDGATGLLFEPGDADDLARKLETLLDDEPLRRRLGEAGRRRFEEHYSWPVIVERHYRPLLRPRPRAGTVRHPHARAEE
jgi:glycosyltransferase involved in cell wall biosynthesis